MSSGCPSWAFQPAAVLVSFHVQWIFIASIFIAWNVFMLKFNISALFIIVFFITDLKALGLFICFLTAEMGSDTVSAFLRDVRSICWGETICPCPSLSHTNLGDEEQQDVSERRGLELVARLQRRASVMGVQWSRRKFSGGKSCAQQTLCWGCRCLQNALTSA